MAYSLTCLFTFDRISKKDCLGEYINDSNQRKIPCNCFYLLSSCGYLYRILLFPRLINLSGDIEKIHVLGRTSLKRSLLPSKSNYFSPT